MTSTTLVTFLVRVPTDVKTVELLGSWDHFKKPYNMQRDVRIGAGHWRGCHFFTDIVYDGETNIEAGRRDGGLKMGATYWYYYRLDYEDHYYNETLAATDACPLLLGQMVNVLNVPISLPSPSSKRRSVFGAGSNMAKAKSIEYDDCIDDDNDEPPDWQEDSLSSDFSSVLNITASPRPHSAPAALPSSLKMLHLTPLSSQKPSIESSRSFENDQSIPLALPVMLDDIDRPRASDFRAKTSVATNRLLTKISNPFANFSSGFADARAHAQPRPHAQDDCSGDIPDERHHGIFDRKRHRMRPKLRRLYTDQFLEKQQPQASKAKAENTHAHEDNHQSHDVRHHFRHQHHQHLHYHSHNKYHHRYRYRYRPQVRRRRGTASRTRIDESIPREKAYTSIKARAILDSSKRVFHHHADSNGNGGKARIISSDSIKRKFAVLRNRYSGQAETSGESDDNDNSHDYDGRGRQKSRLFGRRRKGHGYSRSWSRLKVQRAQSEGRLWYSSGHGMRMRSVVVV